jgi:osmotically inducible lipoprotein OsmB
MRRMVMVFAVAGLGFGLTACGHGVEQRAATGAGVGLVLGGPVGAAVGAGVGVVVSKSTDKRR